MCKVCTEAVHCVALWTRLIFLYICVVLIQRCKNSVWGWPSPIGALLLPCEGLHGGGFDARERRHSKGARIGDVGVILALDLTHTGRRFTFRAPASPTFRTLRKLWTRCGKIQTVWFCCQELLAALRHAVHWVKTASPEQARSWAVGGTLHGLPGQRVQVDQLCLDACKAMEVIVWRSPKEKKNRVVPVPRRAGRYREASVVDLPPCRTKRYDVLVGLPLGAWALYFPLYFPHGSLGSNLRVDLCVDGMTSNKEAMVAETLDKVWDMLLLKFPDKTFLPGYTTKARRYALEITYCPLPFGFPHGMLAMSKHRKLLGTTGEAHSRRHSRAFQHVIIRSEHIQTYECSDGLGGREIIIPFQVLLVEPWLPSCEMHRRMHILKSTLCVNASS